MACLAYNQYYNTTSKSTGTELTSVVQATTTTTILQLCFRDHPGEPMPEVNFWTMVQVKMPFLPPNQQRQSTEGNCPS